MAKLTLEQLDETAWPGWDSFVCQHMGGTVCHKMGWLALVGDSPTLHVVVDGGGAIRGGLGMVLTKKRGIRGAHIPPYTPYFGPLIERSRKEERAGSRTEEQKILSLLLSGLPRTGHVDFRLPPGSVDLYPFHWRGFTLEVGFTHQIEGDICAYERNMAATRRSELRRYRDLESEGILSIEVGGSPGGIFELAEEAAQEKKFNPRADILSDLAGSGLGWDWRAVKVNDREGRLLAGVAMVEDERRALNLVNPTRPLLSGTVKNVNLLAMDIAVRDVLGRGKLLDLEGSMLSGVERFYRLLGAEQVPTFRVQRSNSLWYTVLRAGARALAERRGRGN